jgi:membrane-bound metal-dependent hydrolase YbcI (DUF457 family)
MDTITHGIAGALIAKAAFRGDDMLARPMPATRARIITWSLMLGAIFPDSDVFREFFSKNDMLIMTWHRSVTHSLVCLPLFAIGLAALTRWFAKRKGVRGLSAAIIGRVVGPGVFSNAVRRWLERKTEWDVPDFLLLIGIYAIGILSHILLDLVTSFGTMIWSPLKWSRPAWDLIFIIDFILTTLLLLPQIVAWVYRKPEGLQGRALGGWIVFSVGTLGVAAFALKVGAPISIRAILVAVVLFGAVFLLPVMRHWGLSVRLSSWNFAGLLLSIAYIGAAVYAHHRALFRVDQFVRSLNIEAQAVGALPFPPSLWNWDGLILTPRGVYELRIDLAGEPATAQAGTADANSGLSYHFYPNSLSNPFIESAKGLKEVQTVLWFARFPVIHFRQDNQQAIVEIHDVRFPQIRPDRPASFTYRVRFAQNGALLSQGWVRPN